MPKLRPPIEQFLAYAKEHNYTPRDRFQFIRITTEYDPKTTNRTEIAFTDNPSIAHNPPESLKDPLNYDYAIEVRRYCTDPEVLITLNTSQTYVKTKTYFFTTSTSIKRAMRDIEKKESSH